ncbi:hypothetical protein [Butyricicoccus sp. Marseille-Q5471]|uniref:hypothetical protein n=1 Tax=Butyricicoccus sp. Marseille-Q5471 TaxID=3039493 RepID=UPI0024BCC00B|nr:hypothetical protein [Butyricicoccus sp. Marseille-Q5471]
MDKKEVSGNIPFDFLSEMGHSTRAMDRFFELTPEEREHLIEHASIGEPAEERIRSTLSSLEEGGEGYWERY